MISCIYCNEKSESVKEHVLHMKEKHFHARIRDQYECPLCRKRYLWKNYPRHVNDQHGESQIFEEQMDLSDDLQAYDSDSSVPNIYDDDFITVDEIYDEMLMNYNDSFSTENVNDEDLLLQISAKRLLAECDKNWMELLKKMSVTKKLVSEIYSQYKSIIMSTIDVCTTFMNDEQTKKVTNAVEKELRCRRSEYMRMKTLKKHTSYIPPTAFVPEYRHETYLRNNNPLRVYRGNKIARVHIRKTLEILFSNESLCHSFVYPSDYENASEYSHPFAAERAQELYQKMNSDYIAVRIFMDEFCPVNPLGQASTTNKTMGCYMQILNLPAHLQNLSYIFLVFLALSDDVKDDFQDILDSLLLEELSELENGMLILYKNQEKILPIILHSLVGDNLGVHQMCAFVCSFSGHSPCRFCKVNQEQLKSYYDLSAVTLKTKASYDQAVASNNNEVLRSNGINQSCCLNNLKYFHVMDSLCLDMMHDLPLGFLPRFMAIVITSICGEEGITLERINNALLSFPYRGSARRNTPQKLFKEHLDDGQIKKITASTMMSLVTMLPLVLKTNNIKVPVTNKWWLLYLLFLRILDLLMMRCINEEKLLTLENRINIFLEKYIEEGGPMTVKPHYLLHVTAVIRRQGPLIFHWCMQFEAKHQDFKQYAKVNSNHQDLAMTLAARHQLMMTSFFAELEKEDFRHKNSEYFTMQRLAEDEAVVYGLDNATNLPLVGKIVELNYHNFLLKILQLRVHKFDMDAHAYYASATENFIHININQLLLQQSLPIYRNYIRFPCAL